MKSNIGLKTRVAVILVISMLMEQTCLVNASEDIILSRGDVVDVLENDAVDYVSDIQEDVISGSKELEQKVKKEEPDSIVTDDILADKAGSISDNMTCVRFDPNGANLGTMNDQYFLADDFKRLEHVKYDRIYTITYEYNGATGGAQVSADTVRSSFNGWAASPNGAVMFHDEDMVSVNDLPPAENNAVTLYASWTPGTVSLPSPTKKGYIFDGWYEDSTTSYTFVGNGNTVYTPEWNITVYAKWVEEPVSVNKVTISKEDLHLEVGDSEILSANVKPDNALDKSLVWKSSDPSIATVDNAGKVTAISKGNAMITVTARDGGASAVCTVTVVDKKVEVTDITLNYQVQTIYVGQSVKLNAAVYPDNATDKRIIWTSDDEKVATVSDNGLVVGKGMGTASIRAKFSNGVEAKCSITVKKLPMKVAGVEMIPVSKSMRVGESF